jgi:uncharacterized protein (TIGR03435 family)
MSEDWQLLRDYAENQSGDAFEALVSRYVNLVHSAALRQARDLHMAEEITQAVFILLARKAGSLSSRTILSGWLYRTAHYVAADALKSQRRRQQREQEAHMQSAVEENAPDPTWELLSPFLDEALMRLGEKDRQAVVLHFFEKKTFADVGNRLGMSQDTARKRTSRALEKLRQYLAKRGVASTTAIIALAITANSVQAAPVALAKSVAAVAVVQGATASGSTLALIKGALKLMPWTKTKMVVVAAVVVLAVGGTSTLIAVKAVSHPAGDDAYENIFAHPNFSSIGRLDSAPPTLIVRPTRYPNMGGGIWTTTGKGVFVNADVSELVGIAYGTGPSRMVLPADLPAGSYDYLATLPDHQNEALQAELKKQFGVVAHRETRLTDVLLLKVKNPGLLNASVATGNRQRNYMIGDAKVQNYFFERERCSKLAAQFEGYAHKPILDRTGDTGRHNWTFQWPTRSEPSTPRLEQIWDELLPQLERYGFELVPAREPVELLIVERVQN